ncbi:MAG: 2-amino-4-hydroxy-6-hydroxymethyldihydropteridine diphosphokinase [Armatimonadota bacterium]|nr:2-amino-4-hydroxy-6-hydroxymethyldihydropteridine diphosphokinase [Armatimonadota bacterium]
MSRVFIGIGSNIDPGENIPRALGLLGRDARILAVSTFYRAEPLGRPDQPFFYNGVALVETDLPPDELRSRLRDIENALGRQRQEDKYAARTIDLDLLVYGESVLAEEEITSRPFVAVPLAELAPERELPGNGLTLAQIAAAFDDPNIDPLPEFTELLRQQFTPSLFNKGPGWQLPTPSS